PAHRPGLIIDGSEGRLNRLALHGIAIDVGGMVIGVRGDGPTLLPVLNPELRAFLTTSEPRVVLSLGHHMPKIPLNDCDIIFESPGDWRFCRSRGQDFFVSGFSDRNERPERVALFDRECTSIDVFDSVPPSDEDRANILTDWPFCQVLTACLLGRGRGLLVHSCGVSDSGRGLLFVGNSGHGKSTMARLWAGRAIILNDDRIIIRRREDIFLMYGTPWHGDVKSCFPESVPVHKVFFLSQSTENYAVRVRGARAVAELLTRSFPPFWNAHGMSFTLDFAAALCAAVPLYELGFSPDEGIVEFVRCLD
ncbi:MAG: hypothetical protein V2B18_21895, partial [Pseudomonadota bacterium]